MVMGDAVMGRADLYYHQPALSTAMMREDRRRLSPPGGLDAEVQAAAPQRRVRVAAEPPQQLPVVADGPVPAGLLERQVGPLAQLGQGRWRTTLALVSASLSACARGSARQTSPPRRRGGPGRGRRARRRPAEARAPAGARRTRAGRGGPAGLGQPRAAARWLRRGARRGRRPSGRRRPRTSAFWPQARPGRSRGRRAAAHASPRRGRAAARGRTGGHRSPSAGPAAVSSRRGPFLGRRCDRSRAPRATLDGASVAGGGRGPARRRRPCAARSSARRATPSRCARSPFGLRLRRRLAPAPRSPPARARSWRRSSAGAAGDRLRRRRRWRAACGASPAPRERRSGPSMMARRAMKNIATTDTAANAGRNQGRRSQAQKLSAAVRRLGRRPGRAVAGDRAGPPPGPPPAAAPGAPGGRLLGQRAAQRRARHPQRALQPPHLAPAGLAGGQVRVDRRPLGGRQLAVEVVDRPLASSAQVMTSAPARGRPPLRARIAQLLQRLAQPLERVAHPALHRGLAGADRGRDLGERQVHHLAHQEHLALLDRQRGQRLLDARGHLAVLRGHLAPAVRRRQPSMRRGPEPSPESASARARRPSSERPCGGSCGGRGRCRGCARWCRARSRTSPKAATRRRCGPPARTPPAAGPRPWPIVRHEAAQEVPQRLLVARNQLGERLDVPFLVRRHERLVGHAIGRIRPSPGELLQPTVLAPPAGRRRRVAPVGDRERVGRAAQVAVVVDAVVRRRRRCPAPAGPRRSL